MNRREFLFGLGGTGFDVGTRGFKKSLLYRMFFGHIDGDQDKEKLKAPKEVVIPPSLMLHSKHAKLENLIPFLDLIQANGYKAVTYSEWLQSVENGQPIEKPIFISCDDLTLVNGNSNIVVFRKFKDEFVRRGMRATFAVITQPVMLNVDGTTTLLDEQDEEKWDEIVTWVSDGMELATHSSHHTTLNGQNTLPNPNLDDEDYTQEIDNSVALIEAQLLQRGITYSVKTFITPFGSGYSYQQPNHVIHQQVVDHCKQSGLKIVVGIVEGRTPVKTSGLKQSNNTVTYVGRVGPAEDDGGLDPQRTLGYMNQWNDANDSFEESMS